MHKKTVIPIKTFNAFKTHINIIVTAISVFTPS